MADESPFTPTVELGEAPPDGTVDPAKLVQQLQAQFVDPLALPPQAVKVLIEQLLDASDRFMELAALPRNWDELRKLNLSAKSDEWLRLTSDMWRNNEVLQQLLSKTEAAEASPSLWQEKDEKGLTWFYREVVGPLLDGQCYGEPACSEGAISNYGARPMPITPVAAWPFVTMRAWGVLQEGVDPWWSNVLKSVGEAFEEFSQHVKEGVKDLATAFDQATKTSWSFLKVAGGVAAGVAVLYVVWRLTRPRRNPEKLGEAPQVANP